MPNDLSPDQRQQALDALLAGRKIEAIKIVRQATGMDLKDAKDYIDTIAAELKQADPEAFASQKPGCGSAVLFLALALWLLA